MTDKSSPDTTEVQGEQFNPELGKAVDLSPQRIRQAVGVLSSLRRWKQDHVGELETSVQDKKPGFTRYRNCVYSAVIDGRNEIVEVFPGEGGIAVRDSKDRFVYIELIPTFPEIDFRSIEMHEPSDVGNSTRIVSVGTRKDTNGAYVGVDSAVGERFLDDPIQVVNDGLRILTNPDVQLISSAPSPEYDPLQI